jgi:hypothetical protein
VSVGTDAVDITAPGPFHAGSDVPVLFVGDRSFRSSMYTAPNVIRFSGTGSVAPGDRIALAYGNGPPMVLRKGVP